MNGTPSRVTKTVERMIDAAVFTGSIFSSWIRFPSYTAALELVVPKSRPTRITWLLRCLIRSVTHDKRADGLGTSTLRTGLRYTTIAAAYPIRVECAIGLLTDVAMGCARKRAM